MTDPKEALVVGQASPAQVEFLNSALQLGLDFLEGKPRRGKVVDYVSEESLRREIASHLPMEGETLDGLMRVLRETVARYSVAQGDVRYLAFPDTGNAVAGLAADILSTFLNQNLIAYDRSAPSGTLIEIELIQWLRQLLGYSHVKIDAPDLTLADVGGIWTSGGNMSNHVAMLVALHAKFPEVKKRGLSGLRKRPVIVLAKGIEHFSFASAALSLGLGEDSLVWMEPNADYTSNPEALRRTLQALGEDCEPFMVVSVAGNCRTTSIDDIQTMRDVCDEFGLWLHVDACHGGNLLFSQTLRSRLRGIEQADSVSLDPHKGLFVGYPCSFVLFKETYSLEFVCRYPDKFASPECLDMGLIMPFYGSRGFHALKLWLLIKHLGVNGVGELIEKRQRLNDRLVRRLNRMGLFRLLNSGDYYRTAFVFCPTAVFEEAKDLSAGDRRNEAIVELISSFTRRLSDALYQSGEVVFDAFSLSDLANQVGFGAGRKYATMAMAVGHPEMSQSHEDAIFEAIARIAAPLEMELRATLASAPAAPTPSEPVFSKGPAGW